MVHAPYSPLRQLLPYTHTSSQMAPCANALHVPTHARPRPRPRTQVVSAALPELRVSLGARAAPEGADPNAPLPEGTPLPELTPYAFVPAGEAKGCNMVELLITGG